MSHLPIARLLVEGDRACFRRPEFSSDLVTYDVMPPTIARRLISLALGGDRWMLKRIVVGRPIRFLWDEIVTVRGRKRALTLIDVSYILEACIIDPRIIPNTTVNAIHLGLADYRGSIRLLEVQEQPKLDLAESGTVDLGWMVHDTDGGRPRFFRASMIAGVIDLADDSIVLVS